MEKDVLSIDGLRSSRTPRSSSALELQYGVLSISELIRAIFSQNDIPKIVSRQKTFAISVTINTRSVSNQHVKQYYWANVTVQ